MIGSFAVSWVSSDVSLEIVEILSRKVGDLLGWRYLVLSVGEVSLM